MIAAARIRRCWRISASRDLTAVSVELDRRWPLPAMCTRCQIIATAVATLMAWDRADRTSRIRASTFVVASYRASAYVRDHVARQDASDAKASNQAMQRTAGRSAFTLSMIPTSSLFATRALARGR